MKAKDRRKLNRELTPKNISDDNHLEERLQKEADKREERLRRRIRHERETLSESN